MTTLHRLLEPAMRRWRVVGLVIWALSFLGLSFFTFNLLDDEVLAPWFWPLWDVGTAVVILLFVRRPSNDWYLRLSGGFVVIAYASRVAASIFRWHEGSLLWPRVGTSLIYFTSLSAFGYWFWKYEAKPWALRKTTGLTIYGD